VPKRLNSICRLIVATQDQIRLERRFLLYIVELMGVFEVSFASVAHIRSEDRDRSRLLRTIIHVSLVKILVHLLGITEFCIPLSRRDNGPMGVFIIDLWSNLEIHIVN
jgi:hypothetical protein